MKQKEADRNQEQVHVKMSWLESRNERASNWDKNSLRRQINAGYAQESHEGNTGEFTPNVARGDGNQKSEEKWRKDRVSHLLVGIPELKSWGNERRAAFNMMKAKNILEYKGDTSFLIMTIGSIPNRNILSTASGK